MNSNNPNPKKKKEIEQKIREITETSSDMNKGNPNQNKFFKRNKTKKLLIPINLQTYQINL